MVEFDEAHWCGIVLINHMHAHVVEFDACALTCIHALWIVCMHRYVEHDVLHSRGGKDFDARDWEEEIEVVEEKLIEARRSAKTEAGRLRSEWDRERREKMVMNKSERRLETQVKELQECLARESRLRAGMESQVKDLQWRKESKSWVGTTSGEVMWQCSERNE